MKFRCMCGYEKEVKEDMKFTNYKCPKCGKEVNETTGEIVMNKKTWETGIRNLISKQIRELKEIVKTFPGDERVLGYFSELAKYIQKIEHTIAVLTSAKIKIGKGEEVEFIRSPGGSLAYRPKPKVEKRKI